MANTTEADIRHALTVNGESPLRPPLRTTDGWLVLTEHYLAMLKQHRRQLRVLWEEELARYGVPPVRIERQGFSATLVVHYPARDRKAQVKKVRGAKAEVTAFAQDIARQAATVHAERSAELLKEGQAAHEAWRLEHPYDLLLPLPPIPEYWYVSDIAYRATDPARYIKLASGVTSIDAAGFPPDLVEAGAAVRSCKEPYGGASQTIKWELFANTGIKIAERHHIEILY